MHYRITGPSQLEGRFRPSGNKNGALPILAGCMLAEAPVTLENVPEIRDVFTMIELLRNLGAGIDRIEPNTFRVDPHGIESGAIDPDLSRRIRASILLAGPLLARRGEVVLPPPGGDVIGRRRLDTHFLALGQLGAEVEAGESYELRDGRGSCTDPARAARTPRYVSWWPPARVPRRVSRSLCR